MFGKAKARITMGADQADELSAGKNQNAIKPSSASAMCQGQMIVPNVTAFPPANSA